MRLRGQSHVRWGIERSAAILILLARNGRRSGIGRDAGPVSLNECGAEPSANSFAAPSTTGTVRCHGQLQVSSPSARPGCRRSGPGASAASPFHRQALGLRAGASDRRLNPACRLRRLGWNGVLATAAPAPRHREAPRAFRHRHEGRRGTKPHGRLGFEPIGNTRRNSAPSQETSPAGRSSSRKPR